MRIETAPVEWLRAVVEAACEALEINPAMLPTDGYEAAQKVKEEAGGNSKHRLATAHDLLRRVRDTLSDMPSHEISDFLENEK